MAYITFSTIFDYTSDSFDSSKEGIWKEKGLKKEQKKGNKKRGQGNQKKGSNV
jgi:hypothetical protein